MKAPMLQPGSGFRVRAAERLAAFPPLGFGAGRSGGGMGQAWTIEASGPGVFAGGPDPGMLYPPRPWDTGPVVDPAAPQAPPTAPQAPLLLSDEAGSWQTQYPDCSREFLEGCVTGHGRPPTRLTPYAREAMAQRGLNVECAIDPEGTWRYDTGFAPPEETCRINGGPWVHSATALNTRYRPAGPPVYVPPGSLVPSFNILDPDLAPSPVPTPGNVPQRPSEFTWWRDVGGGPGPGTPPGPGPSFLPSYAAEPGQVAQPVVDPGRWGVQPGTVGPVDGEPAVGAEAEPGWLEGISPWTLALIGVGAWLAFGKR